MKSIAKLMVFSMIMGIVLALVFLQLNISPDRFKNSFLGIFRLPENQKIEKSITSYFNAWIKGDAKAMYMFLSNKDRLVVSIDTYMSDFNSFPVHPEGFTIQQIKIKNNHALVTTKISWPRVEDFAPEQKQTQLFVMIKENNIWKITEQDTFQ